MIITSEFCDVDAEHQGPAVQTLVNERPVFVCAKCWKDRGNTEQFPLANEQQ